MACPSRDRLARAALGPDRELSDHLAACPACRSELATMRSVLARLAEAHASLERGHDEERERLLSLLPGESHAPTRSRARTSFTQWMGGSTMRRRMVFGGLGTLGVLTIGLLWVGLTPGKASAMDAVAEAVRKAKSYRCVMTDATDGDRIQGLASPPSRYAWRADGSFRSEREGTPLAGEHDVVMIMPAGRPGIELDRTAKRFARQAAQLGRTSQLWMVEGLAAYTGDADRDLGEKVVEGKPARGFLIASEKIDPDNHRGLLEIWVDVASNLPVRLSFTLTYPSGHVTLRMQDFVWNVDLTPDLFDPTPPEGYVDATPAPQKLEEQVADIVDGLKIYAKYSGGHYPRVVLLYGDVTTNDLVRLSGAPYPPKTDDEIRDDRTSEIYGGISGFSRIHAILRDNPDAAYHGKTVGPADGEKVLLRWKADDGGYHVLFGDLRFETVTPARLRILEAARAG